MLRRFDKNQTRHDEFQRSLEELKDMMRTLLVMETGSSTWWPSTNQTMSESQHEKQTSASSPSLFGVEFNLEANSETQDHGELCSLPEDQEIVELRAIEGSDFRDGPTYYPTLVEELKEPDPSSGLVELYASEPSCYPLKFSELQSISPCDPLVLNLDQYPAKVKVKLDPLVTDFASDGSTKMRDSVDLSIAHFVPMDECNSFADVIIDAAPKGMGDMITMTINWIEFDMDDLGTNSGAHKVFDKLSEHDVFRLESNLISHNVESSLVMDLVVAKHRLWAENLVFDPGIVDRYEFIHGDFTVSILVLIGTEINVGVLLSLNHSNWVFDPGGAFALLASGPKWMSNGVEATRKVEVVDQGLQWGPGGLCVDLMRFCVLVCCNFVLGCGDFVLLMIL